MAVTLRDRKVPSFRRNGGSRRVSGSGQFPWIQTVVQVSRWLQLTRSSGIKERLDEVEQLLVTDKLLTKKDAERGRRLLQETLILAADLRGDKTGALTAPTPFSPPVNTPVSPFSLFFGTAVIDVNYP